MTLIRSSDAKISNTMTRYIRLPVLRAFYGLILSFGSPLGWLLLQWLAGRNPLSESFLDPLLYGYLILATSVVFSFMGYRIGLREQVITDMALTDGLTALYNKRYFKNRMEQEFERHLRHQTPMSIIQIDLDYFKEINDTWGHQAGDEVLKTVASTIMANCRKNEIAARVGGEEICIIASDCLETEAIHLAERLRTAIEAGVSSWQSKEIKVTASFGVASAQQDSVNAWEVYQHADEALYQAKQAGRNRVLVYHPA